MSFEISAPARAVLIAMVFAPRATVTAGLPAGPAPLSLFDEQPSDRASNIAAVSTQIPGRGFPLSRIILSTPDLFYPLFPVQGLFESLMQRLR